MPDFPHIDASTQDCITDDDAHFFRENGLLLVRNVLRGQELAALQDQMGQLVHRAVVERPLDYRYKPHAITGEEVPYRVEYVIDKTAAGKALLGHPFVLATVEKLQGPNFIPTWDSMVFKQPGAGAAIPWHRDAAAASIIGDRPIFNVGFYLDASDLSNCLWGIPGSNQWPEDEARRVVQTLNGEGEFKTDGAIPLTMQPGDVIIHNILAVHGSPPAQSALRRVLYYEFRPAEVEQQVGPHTPDYIPLKQRVLLACLRDRAATTYTQGETPYHYRPSAAFAPPAFAPTDTLDTYRYPHDQYWRATRGA